MNTKTLHVFLSMLVLATLSAHALTTQARTVGTYKSVWECDEEKFTWYCDEQPEEPRAVAPAPAPTSAPSPAPAPAPTQVAPKPPAKPVRVEIKDLKTAEQFRAELKRREDLAVMNPTPEHVKDYMTLNAHMQDKASTFADVWRRVQWQTPELDYSAKNPSNTTAIRVKAEERGKTVEHAMTKIGKEHGLIFFYRSDCPYCHAMAPNLKLLTQRFGIEVLYVAMDGKPLPGQTPFVTNKGQYETLRTRHKLDDARVPALFIASKKNGDTAPIGVGTLAFTDITERIYVLTQTSPNSEF